MTKPPLQWPLLPPGQPPRCLSCAYVLKGLDDCRCPECGREFNPRDPHSYTTKPPFLAWKFGLPGLSLAIIGGAIGTIVLWRMGNWGYSLWFGVPFAAGALLGYRFRAGCFLLVMAMVSLATMLVLGAVMLDIAGVFCGLVLAVVYIGPIFAGTLLGSLLRVTLKKSRFSQRWHLPVLMLTLMPIGCGIIEGKPPIHAPESVSTTAVINATASKSWDAIVFYEEVTHEPPLILKIGLVRPLYTTGSSSAVGDVKTCVYNKGRIVKRITEVKPHELLTFEVIEQRIGYERDVALRCGKFEFTEIDAHHTRVTLTTEYTPLLTPRWAWRPFEAIAIHTLHGHVIEGMRKRTVEPVPSVAINRHAQDHGAN